MRPHRISGLCGGCLGLISALLLFSAATAASIKPDSKTIEQFFYAIQVNDTNIFRQLLDTDTNLANAAYSNHLPLHRAVSLGNLAMVKALLKAGADINAQNDAFNSSGMLITPLQVAIWYGKTNIFNWLLDAGANPNLQSAFEGTALHSAFNYRHPEMAERLLAHGANPFLEKNNPYNHATPLELAITQSDGRLVPRMLALGRKDFASGKFAAKTSSGRQRNHLKPTFAGFMAGHGAALLSAAAQRGELEAVQSLLNAGASIPKHSEAGAQMLQAFARSEAAAAKSANFYPARWLQIRDLLIQNGANYDVFAATALNDTKRTQHLLSENQKVVQTRDKSGQTPLDWAIQTDRPQMVLFWIHAGAPLAATNDAGQTALHLAAAAGQADFVKTLLAAQAPTNLRDTNSWTPLDAAIHARQSDCIHLLLAGQAVPAHPERGLATALHQAAAGNIAALAALLETETNLEARNELGLTPLQVAVTKGHLAAAALLVDKGANLNVRDPDGNSLLHLIFLSQYTVFDRPPASWLAQLKAGPNQQTYLKYLTVGQNEQGPNPVLQGVSFLLACGLNAGVTNHAGETVMQWVTEDKIGRGIFFFDDDREKLIKLLSGAGGNVERRDAAGNTALHQLCTGGYDVGKVDQMAALIAGGADVNATNNLGETPLHLAAKNIGGWDGNNPPVDEPFQLLIYRQANVNAQDNAGLTPLDVLATSDSTFKREATKTLLDAGANPNLRDQQRRTTADFFLSGKWPWNGAGESLALLLKSGADLSAKDDEGKTPLHYLAALGNQDPMFFIRSIGDLFLAAKVNLNARDNDGDTPLHIAAKTGTRDVFDWLVKHGADLDATNNAGQTPRLLLAHASNAFPSFGPPNAETDIFEAVREGKLEPLAALIKADPSLANTTNQVGQTSLRLAILTHRTNVVAFLEQHGARWDIVSAVLFGQTNALREILARQPDAVAVKNYGSPLLQLAAANGDVATTKILLADGSDVRVQDFRGLSALGVAGLNNHPSVAEVLRQHGATETIFDAAYNGLRENAAELIKQNKSLALAANALGVSVLDIAAGTGHAGVLKLLLDNGASARKMNARIGETPLHLAADYNQTNTARLLIRKGAKVNAFNRQGFTPLQLATICGATEVAALLLKNHADPNLVTTESSTNRMPRMPMMGGRASLIRPGDSALHLAAVLGQTNLVRLLLASGATVNATDGLGRTPLDLAAAASVPPAAFVIRRPLIGMNVLGIAGGPPPFPSMQSISERQKMVEQLLEQAGGKRLQKNQPFGRPPGFLYQTPNRLNDPQ